jgi:RNA polymerase sigma factor (sigma-70 family)
LANQNLEQTILGCRNSERLAQKELYTQFYGFSMSIALRYASNYDNAVEMVNDGFLKIFRDLRLFEPKFNNLTASFTAWLRRVMVNACIDHLRKYKNANFLTSVEGYENSYVDPTANAEQIMEYKEILQSVQRLSPQYRTVFNLYVLEGLSHSEIAQKLNISENTSKSNLFKARQNLMDILNNRTKGLHANSRTY